MAPQTSLATLPVVGTLDTRPDDFRQAVIRWLIGYANPHTRSAYASDLADFAGWCQQLAGIEPLQATRSHLEAYAGSLSQHRAPATVGRRLAALTGFYGWCLDEGILTLNPAARIRRPRVPSDSPRLGLDKAEAVAFLAAAADPVGRALAHLLTLNGLRVSEAVGARIEDLSTERGHRTLTITRKRGARELVPLAPPTLAAIEDVVGDRSTGPILTDADGEALNRDQAAWIVRRLAKAAGITKRISPHSLRHSSVTLALDAGVPLRDVQHLAAHADPKTTIRYDRARGSLDRHATYALASFLAGD